MICRKNIDDADGSGRAVRRAPKTRTFAPLARAIIGVAGRPIAIGPVIANRGRTDAPLPLDTDSASLAGPAYHAASGRVCRELRAALDGIAPTFDAGSGIACETEDGWVRMPPVVVTTIDKGSSR
jgi:hypothetical protein